MPKAAKHHLTWSATRGDYVLHEHNVAARTITASDQAVWLTWLDTHTSVAFIGQHGRMNLLKEARKNGASYWYAYRRSGKQIVKRYLGRSVELTFARLEAVAGALAEAPQHAAEVSKATLVPQTLDMPLLTPKLQLPRLPSDLIVRERLFALLDAGFARKLTLITAPAGFGKTTLVRQWLAARTVEHDQNSTFKTQTFSTAWLSLDDGDNDPVRFWRYVITACQAFHSELGFSMLTLLTTMHQPPFAPLSQAMVLTPLLNELSQQMRRSVLVLEDYHLISEPQIHAAMNFFIEHLPDTLHLVILTRNETSLPLARLRASGDVCDIAAPDLRFSLNETQRFFEDSQSAPLTSETITQIDARLEGWAAGLRLLTLALHHRHTSGEIAQVLSTFVGGHRPVLDYFVAEVLQAQPPHIQDFLLRTAALDRLTGALCDAMLGEQSEHAHTSSHILEELARANVFLEPLDDAGAWYRYHALFADAMRYEARRRFGGEVLVASLVQASGWYEQHGLLAEAIEAALRACEFVRAAVLMERLLNTKRIVIAFQPFAEANETHTLQRWLEQLPKTVLAQHPLLCLNYAIVLLLVLMEGRTEQASKALIEEAVQLAEAGFRASDNRAGLGEAYAFRSMIVKQHGAIDESVAWARQALTLLPVEAFTWRAACLSAIGTGEEFAGRLSTARQLLLEARAISEAIGNWSFARAILGMLSHVYIEQGEPHRAVAHLRHTLAEARAQGDRDDVGHAQLELMQLSYEWNDLVAAEQQAREAYAVGIELKDQGFMAQAALMLAWLTHIRGDTAAAQQHVSALLEQLPAAQTPRQHWHTRAALAMQARLQLATGDVLAAQRWADTHAQDTTSLPYFQRTREQLLVTRLLLDQQHSESARDRLVQSLQTAQQAGHTHHIIENQVLLSVAYAACKQPNEARSLLLTTLAGAAGAGYIRLFVDEGPRLATLLRTLLPAIHPPPLATYANTLLRSFAPEHTPPARLLTEALSFQEQRVLQLLATGCTNAQIATHLIVSINTVKAHLKNIYRKLNVSTRMQASAIARQSA